MGNNFSPEQAGLRRLTVPQYQNSLKDLFGDTTTYTTVFEEDTELSGFASIGAARVGLSPAITEQFEATSYQVAKNVLSDTTRRAALVGCSPTGATDDIPVRPPSSTKIGRRAWRRPMTAEEVTRYVGVAKNAQTVLKTFFGGLEYGLAGLLQSPHFLYRVELGLPDPKNANRVVFNDNELATRLSYFLWNTTPDDQLLDAAEMQQLTKGTGFATQVQRLLDSPRSVAATQEFFTEYYRLAEMDKLPADPTLFPLKTQTIGAAMREETLRFLTDIALTRKADYRDIFDSRNTFVNAELAKLYGLPAGGANFAPVTLPDTGMRLGYLGQGSFLALNAHPNVTSPTHRGKFIMEMILCQSIPPPPDNVPPLPETMLEPLPRRCGRSWRCTAPSSPARPATR